MRAARIYGTAVGILAGLTLLSRPAPCSALQQTPVTHDTEYAHVSVSRGGVTLVESETGEFVSVEGAEAVLVGDELRLSPGALAEVRLSDRNVLRLGDRAEVVLHALAGSPDRTDAMTVLQLRRGAMQVLVVDDFRGDAPPAIETDNAYVELRGPGAYLIDAGVERTVLAVRSGAARVRGASGFTTVRAGEEAVVEGFDGSRVRVAGARRLTSVERWGEELAGSGALPSEVYVEQPVPYAAASLSGYGNWVRVRGTWGWRPRVTYAWRPYWYGRWRHTPTGLLWVSYEPWGWVPHHYGSWDLVPGYGWVWFPGPRFASAWVFWYWGPEYVGWIPWGYYSRHYGPRFHLTVGVYGWAGGLTAHFGDWCFTPFHRFGHRHQHRYLKTGRALGRDRNRLERGVITTDTRGMTPGHWTTPERATRLLTFDPERGRARELGDAGPFIYREREGRIPVGWKPPADRRPVEREAPLVHPVRTTPLVTAEATQRDRGPDARPPRALDEAVNRTASIDPVRTTRTVELRREPTVRETARREVRERPAIDPVRTTRAVEVRREPTVRETARREVRERPPIDPVQPARTVEVRREPTVRETARREVREQERAPSRPTSVSPTKPASPRSGSATPSGPKTRDRTDIVDRPAPRSSPTASGRSAAPRATPSGTTPSRTTPARATAPRAEAPRAAPSRAAKGASGSKPGRSKRD